MQHRGITHGSARRIGIALLVAIAGLVAGCGGQPSAALDATVTALEPQVATAVSGATTAQIRAEAASGQAATAQSLAATAQMRAEAASGQAATAQSLAATAMNRPAPTALPGTPAVQVGAALLPLRRGLSILAQRGTDYKVIAFPIHRVQLYRDVRTFSPDDPMARVELVLAEVMTGTFTLRYNATSVLSTETQLDRWSVFTAQAAVQAGADGSLTSMVPLVATEVPQGHIAATAPFTQTLEDGTIRSIEEVLNLLSRDQIDLKHATFLLAEQVDNQTSYVFVTQFDPGPGSGGGLFESWCQTCVEGACTIFCY